MKACDTSVKEFPDMTSVYCYKFGDERLPVGPVSVEEGACVKHIFTGPYEGLKIQATALFTQIQEGIELGWQSVTTGIAEGTSRRFIRCLCLTAPAPFRSLLLLGITPPRLG